MEYIINSKRFLLYSLLPSLYLLTVGCIFAFDGINEVIGIIYVIFAISNLFISNSIFKLVIGFLVLIYSEFMTFIVTVVALGGGNEAYLYFISLLVPGIAAALLMCVPFYKKHIKVQNI